MKHLTALLALLPLTFIHAGPYPGAAGSTGSDAIPADDPSIIAWATSVAHHLPGSALALGFGDYPEAGLGWANGMARDGTPDCGATVSLGRGGQVTVTFPQPVADRPGADFAVFENSFDDNFLELAYVEVSADGTNFVRFPTTSLTQQPVGPFDPTGVDPTDIDGFAGKHRAGFGTPFDLADIGLATATHIRLVDTVGGGPAQDTDSHGNPVNDPYPTDISSGFDLDAVAVLHTLTPYETWAAETGDLQDPNADPDRDGAPNLLEFAADTDPQNPSSLPKLTIHPQTLLPVLDLAPLHGGYDLTVESSPDLITWSPDTTHNNLRLKIQLSPQVAALLAGHLGSAPFDPCTLFGAH